MYIYIYIYIFRSFWTTIDIVRLRRYAATRHLIGEASQIQTQQHICRCLVPPVKIWRSVKTWYVNTLIMTNTFMNTRMWKHHLNHFNIVKCFDFRLSTPLGSENTNNENIYINILYISPMPRCDHGVDSSHLRNPTITGGPKRSHVAANSQPSASSFQRHTLRVFIVRKRPWIR